MPKTLHPKSFQQWQSELDAFVADTKSRLNALSAALAKCPAIAKTNPQDRVDMSDEHAQPPTQPVASQPAALQQMDVDRVENRPSSVIPPEPPLPTQERPHESQGLTAEDCDPTDRLAAIKMRLAKQIEKA